MSLQDTVFDVEAVILRTHSADSAEYAMFSEIVQALWTMEEDCDKMRALLFKVAAGESALALVKEEYGNSG